MAIKLIAADMDGTLLNDRKEITPRTLAAVRAAMAAGALFVLNSGRMPESVLPYARQLQVNAPIICYNGALTCGQRDGEALDAIPLPLTSAREILRYAERKGLYIQGFWGDRFYCEKYTPKTEEYEEKAAVTAVVCGRPLSEVIDRDAYKLLVIVDEGQMPGMLADFRQRYSAVANCAASSSTYLEIVSPKANKGDAMLKLAASRGIVPEEIMAFGDELNDLSMLRAAGEGYAMANAKDEVREKAACFAPANSEDGLAQVLEKACAQGRFAAPGRAQ